MGNSTALVEIELWDGKAEHYASEEQVVPKKERMPVPAE